MESVANLIRTPEFWFGSVLVGIAVNIVSHILIKVIPNGLSKVGGWKPLLIGLLTIHSLVVLLCSLAVSMYGDYVPFAQREPASVVDRVTLVLGTCIFALSPIWPLLFQGARPSNGAEIYWLICLLIAACFAWFMATADLYFAELHQATTMERMGLVVYSSMMSAMLIVAPALLGAGIFSGLRALVRSGRELFRR